MKNLNDSAPNNTVIINPTPSTPAPASVKLGEAFAPPKTDRYMAAHLAGLRRTR